MNSMLVSPPVGVQRPRVLTLPDSSGSVGREAADLARAAGLILDPWQEFVIESALGRREDASWSSFEVGLVVSRQNGKGAVLEARQLAGLFLLGERLIIHSAHQFDTSLEAFRRLLFLIEDNADLSRRVKRVSRSHGEEGIELLNGQRIRFRTRTKGGGRGFSADCLILDEAMELSKSAHSALMPTLSARPNPQVWYTGSAVDREVHENGEVFARIRQRGIEGGNRLAYFEWSAEGTIDTVDPMEPDAWARANPGLGIRITAEHVSAEQESMDPKAFCVERLGIGDWPDLDALAGQGLSFKAWTGCTDTASVALDPVCFAFDVKPDRSAGAICAAGRRSDGLVHVEVVEHRPGTGWIAPTLAKLVEANEPLAVVADKVGPAAALLTQLEGLDVDVETLSAQQMSQACGVMFDAVEQGTVRHLGTQELRTAVKGAVKRPLGDAFAWSRKSSGVDISPLVACTAALWRLEGEFPDDFWVAAVS